MFPDADVVLLWIILVHGHQGLFHCIDVSFPCFADLADDQTSADFILHEFKTALDSGMLDGSSFSTAISERIAQIQVRIHY